MQVTGVQPQTLTAEGVRAHLQCPNSAVAVAVRTPSGGGHALQVLDAVGSGAEARIWVFDPARGGRINSMGVDKLAEKLLGVVYVSR